MKNMTPMKKLSNNIQQMRSYLNSHFKEVVLNKSAPKRNYHAGEYSENVGVENDFLIIFSDKARSLSFGFIFNYINLPESEHSVTASIKTSKSNDDIINSQPMTMDEFKSHINSFNKWLKENESKHLKNPKASLEIVQEFSEKFLQNKMDIKKEVDKKQKEIEEFISLKSEELKLPQLNEDFLKAQKKIDNAKDVIKKTIESSAEYLELESLKKRTEFLKKLIKTNEEQLEKKLELNKLRINYLDSQQNLMQAKRQLNESVENQLKGTTKLISRKIKR